MILGGQWALYLTLFQVMMGFGVVMPILPYFARELGATSLHMGLMVTAWAGAQFLFSPLWGAWSDRVGRRPVILIGLTGYAVALGLVAVAQDIWVMLLARFLGGTLSAATIPTAQAYIADVSSEAERTRYMAAMGAAMNLGFMSGPAVGGLLASTGLGYRGTFLIAAAMGLVNLVLALLTLPEPPQRQNRSAVRGVSGIQAIGLALTSAEALLFVLAFVASFGGSSLFSMLGYFVKDRLEVGPGALSVAFTVEAVTATLLQAILMGPVSRRLGEETAVSWALVVGGTGFILLALARHFLQVLGAVILIATGLAFIRPLVAAMLSQRTTLEQGTAMGIQAAFDALGRSVGPLWAGAVFLWRDWAPFLSSAAMYLLFFAITRRMWQRPHLAGHRLVVGHQKPPAG